MSKRGKKTKKTRYGQFANGERLTADVIAGQRAGKGSDGDDAQGS